jgi:RNA polymerase sigma-70 factor, ECF subfamily
MACTDLHVSPPETDRVRAGKLSTQSELLAVVADDASSEPANPHANDAALVEAFVAGDMNAFRALWDRHSDALYRFLRRAFGPDASSEDLLQEAFLVLALNAKRIRDPVTLRKYLLTIAGRLAVSERRRRRRREHWEGALSPTPDRSCSLPLDFEAREAILSLDRVLQRLSRRRRDAFILYCIEHFTMEQTAIALSISEATARREVVRARDSVLRWCRIEPALKGYSEMFRPTP